MNDPADAQRAAADPNVSAWVAANAGSGKTRVLTERVARLLLEGARPERIICLTYTKAAAAEMQNRLFGTLGEWAMMDDEPLRKALLALTGHVFEQTQTPAGVSRSLADARRLFAMALETPGGLKIQTIHAFCDSLLRRFPLEAGAPPEFRVMDDREKTALVDRLLNEMADDAAFLDMAALMDESTLRETASDVMGARDLFPPEVNDADYCAAFGTPAPPDEESALKNAMARLNTDALQRMIAAWAQGAATDQKKAAKLDVAQDGGLAVLADELIATMFTTAFKPRAKHASAGAKKAEPDVEALCASLEATAAGAMEARNAAVAAERSLRLARFGGALVDRYNAAKAAAALLDFDDLVGKARDLLTRSDMAAWALYRLDGGVDHVLVDEAQDTSPAQWDVIRAITGEFTSGEGAREAGRTTFVVGDEKQSIYSFQGAAPGEFDAKRGLFASDWNAVGAEMREVALEASFRSAPLILDVVDKVFAGDRAIGLTASGAALKHLAHHRNKAGRVELWPMVEPLPKPKEPDPWEPIDAITPDNPRARLSDQVATRISEMIKAETPLPGNGRAVQAGDILILLQGRPNFLGPLVSGLKKLGVPVAGADRLKLGEDLGVKDLLSLMRFSVTQTDDLSLAEVLRSPLCSVSEDDLLALAYGRKSSLWLSLRAQSMAHERDAAMLDDMLGQADFLRPYEFLERALVNHDGRRRMVARLGRQAEDAIDELLTQAMLYEALEPPSLSGFLAWMAAGDEDVKREQEGARGEVRVMTCHGAKGLEAPVVILPDTMRDPGGPKGKVATAEIGGQPRAIWRAAKKADCALTSAVREAEAEAAQAEHRRLLYVAMTRAEDWLIIGGAGKADKTDGKWRGLIEAGLGEFEMTPLIAPGAPEGAQVLQTGQKPREEKDDDRVEATIVAAPWLSQRAATPTKLQRRAASALAPHEGSPPDPDFVPEIEADLAPRPETGEPLLREAALVRGEAIHLALETGGDDLAALRAVIDAAASDLSDDIREGAALEALAARRLPDAAAFFAPDALAEVGVSILSPNGGQRVVGRIDRLIVTDDLIRFVDFKSDSRPPAPGVPPQSYVLQMAAYRAALQAIYPGQRIEASLLWTAAPRLERLDEAAMDVAWADLW